MPTYEKAGSRRKRWRAAVKVNGRMEYGGYYATRQEALTAEHELRGNRWAVNEDRVNQIRELHAQGLTWTQIGKAVYGPTRDRV